MGKPTNTDEIEKYAERLAQHFSGELLVADDDELIIRAEAKSGRRFEISVDTYVELELRVALENSKGYVDLYFDEEAATEGYPEDFDDTDDLDEHFDLHTKELSHGAFLHDYARNIEMQSKVLAALPSTLLTEATTLMQEYGIDNIEIDYQLATVSFEDDLSEGAPSVEKLSNLVDQLGQLLSNFE